MGTKEENWGSKKFKILLSDSAKVHWLWSPSSLHPTSDGVSSTIWLLPLPLGEPCPGQRAWPREPETQPQVWLGCDFDVGLLGSCLVLQATSPILLPTELKIRHRHWWIWTDGFNWTQWRPPMESRRLAGWCLSAAKVPLLNCCQAEPWVWRWGCFYLPLAAGDWV